MVERHWKMYNFMYAHKKYGNNIYNGIYDLNHIVHLKTCMKWLFYSDDEQIILSCHRGGYKNNPLNCYILDQVSRSVVSSYT